MLAQICGIPGQARDRPRIRGSLTLTLSGMTAEKI